MDLWEGRVLERMARIQCLGRGEMVAEGMGLFEYHSTMKNFILAQ